MWDLQIYDFFLSLQMVVVRVCTTSVQLDRSYSGHINKGHCIVWWCFLKRHTQCAWCGQPARSIASFDMRACSRSAVCAMWSKAFSGGPLAPLWSATTLFSPSTLLHCIHFFLFLFPCFSDPCCGDGEAHFGLLLVVYSSVVVFFLCLVFSIGN